jgi:amino acid transporter
VTGRHPALAAGERSGAWAVGLSPKTLTGPALWFFCVGASSPMTVFAGAFAAAWATTGVVGLPLSFLLVGVPLWLLTVGYLGVARHVGSAAPCYSVLLHGLGRVLGVAGAGVAVLGYVAIQAALYALVAATMSAMLGWSWIGWSIVAGGLVGVAGVVHPKVNARVLTVLLVAEVAVIAVFDVFALAHAAGARWSWAPLAPGRLLTPGVGGAFAMTVACFIGYENGPGYGEEARTPGTVRRASFAALGFLVLFYCGSATAVVQVAGPDRVVALTRDGSGWVPFRLFPAVMGEGYGQLAAAFGQVLLVTSVLAAALALHNAVARYVFALARERVLPPAWAATNTGRSAGAPWAGSLVSSTLATAVLVVAAVLGVAPMALFTWGAAVGAVAIMVVLVATAPAALRFFHRGGGSRDGVWVRRVAPWLGLTSGLAVLATMVANGDSLLGLPPADASLKWVVPGLVGGCAIVAASRAVYLRTRHRLVYDALGAGPPSIVLQRVARFSNLEV